MVKIGLMAFVGGAVVGAGAATYLSRKKAPPAPSGTSARDVALAEEAMATQTITPM